MGELGKLERLPKITDEWPTEEGDLSPFIASDDGLTLLSQTLGLGEDGLELIRTEAHVGKFRVDIFCRDRTSDDEHVVIENQFGKTDHDHLGKLVTYASGLKAKTIIWIAEEIRDEHRAACDWLNSISESDIRFFALEIELWRIGESNPAPKFNVVSKPNDWSRTTGVKARKIEARAETELKQAYQKFWDQFTKYAKSAEPNLRFSEPRPSQYLTTGVGAGIHIGCAISDRNRQLKVEAVLKAENADAQLEYLKELGENFQNTFGAEIKWDEKPGKARASLSILKEDIDPTEETTWNHQFEWMLRHTVLLKSFLNQHLPHLKAAENTLTS